MSLSYLLASVTQGSADAFAEASVATALQGLNNVAFRVREIFFEAPPGAIRAINVLGFEASITRRTKTAMPTVNDRDVIAKVAWEVGLVTSGAIFGDRVRRLTFTEDDEVLIVEDPVFLQVDSAATGLANVLRARIGYERVSISALDRLSLLTQSLD